MLSEAKHLSLSKHVKQCLFEVARTKLARSIIGWLFAYMSFALPVDRLYESQGWVVFYHPSPSYPFHVLWVPKRAIPKLTGLTAADASLLTELVQITQLLVIRFNLEDKGYRLITDSAWLCQRRSLPGYPSTSLSPCLR